MINILFIGAHPDDIELGCGGTIIKHLEKKDNVFVLILSRGENGQNGHKVNRADETLRSLCSISVKRSNIKILNIPDTDFSKENKTIFHEIEHLCEIKKIHQVYTHTNKESHQDHITTYEETLRAARNVPNILTYETNAHSLPIFSPNFFVDISEVINKKMELIGYHNSQSGKKYMEAKNTESLAKVRGYQSRGGEYAEGFEVIRMNSK